MDAELIWWIVAATASIIGTFILANYHPRYNDDPYRYCPKEE